MQPKSSNGKAQMMLLVVSKPSRLSKILCLFNLILKGFTPQLPRNSYRNAYHLLKQKYKLLKMVRK